MTIFRGARQQRRSNDGRGGVDFVQWLMPLSGRSPLRARLTWHPKQSSDVGPLDVVARFGGAFTGLRWCALVLAVVIGTTEHVGGNIGPAGAVLALYALGRTVHPISSSDRGWKTTVSLLFEVAVGVAVVEVTGFGSSPYLVCLGVATAIAGFTGGLRVVTGITAVAVGAVVVPSVILISDRGVANLSTEVASILVLVAVASVFSRYLLDDARRVEVSLVERVAHLSQVNELLLDLHRETEGRFTSMSVDAIARWGVERLDTRFSSDSAVVVLLDPETRTWHVAAGHGVAHWDATHLDELPSVLAAAASAGRLVEFENLRDGLGYRSEWAMYCPLEARGEIVGVVGVEDRLPRSATADDRRQLVDLARAAAMAVDNAHWLAEIHERGAERERSRLARELHDHVGQSVVYLGFELDRLAAVNEGRTVRHDLLTLREDMRELAVDLRGTLVSLRCDVSSDRGIEELLPGFLARVESRTKISTSMAATSLHRPVLSVERQFWNVAKEAITNAERHADASMVSVVWRSDTSGAVLEISDDGIGLPEEFDDGGSYGILGMRERAESVGARLDITSKPGRGTVVRMQKEMER